MSVYIELVLFNNFAIDMLLEVCTLTVMGRSVRKFRCFLAALFGAGVAAAYAIAPTGWKIAVRILLAPIMTVIFFRPKEGKALARIVDIVCGLAVFCALTFLVGGAAQGIGYLLGVDVNGYPQLGLVAMALAICVLSVRAVVKRRASKRADIVDVRLCAAGKKIDCKALKDSGNMLVDSFSGLPVVIISGRLAHSLDGCAKEGFIDVNTVNGSNSLPLVKLDGVEVGGNDLAALGAISASDMDGCDVILQASMF